MLYCNYININDKWVCGQCGTTINQKITNNKKPFSLCKIHINNKYITDNVLLKKGTPFGFSDNVSVPIKYPENGPGTELKKILSYIGITPTQSCNCNKRANTMNAWGADKCNENIDIILDWLKEEADSRKLPFIRSLAKVLVKKAIKNSKKLSSSSFHP
jgi:hypothetical protein